MARDGSIEFDARIKTGDLEKDLENVEESISGTASEAEKRAEEAYNIMLAQAKKLAAEYEKSGMKSSEALRKAWNDMKRTAAAGADNVKQTASRAFDEIADSAESALSDSSQIIDDFSDKIKDALAAAGTIAGAAEIVKVGTDYDKAMQQVAASTGAAGKELESLQTIASNVYTNNFGDSMEDAATGATEVYKQLELVDEELQTATESAFLLKDTFGYEVAESTKAAKSMVSNLGIDAQKAYDLIATGAQKGADSSGELLDTLNEYSADFAEAGLSADQFMTMLINAGDNGVYSIDKVGDAVRELNTRAKDGSETTAEAFEILGMDAEEMSEKFAAGGQTAQDAFAETITAINYLEDPVARNTAAVGLLGSMYEDVGDGLVTTLASVTDGANIASGALEDMAEVKYNDLESQFEALRRQVETEVIVPLAKEFMPEIKEAMGWVSDNLDEIITYGKPIATAMAAAFATTKIVEFGSSAVKTIKTVKAAFTALNTSNPLGWIALGVSAVVGLGSVIATETREWQEHLDDVREASAKLTEEQQNVADSIKDATESWEKFEQSRESLASEAEVEYQNIVAIKEKLDELIESDGRIKEGTEEEVAELLEKLSAYTGECYDISDGVLTKNDKVVESYQKLSGEIDNLIEKQRAQSLLSAYETDYNEKLIERKQLLQDVADQQAELKELDQQIIGKQAEIDYVWGGNAPDELQAEIDGMREKRDELYATYQEGNSTLQEMAAFLQFYDGALKSYDNKDYSGVVEFSNMIQSGFMTSDIASLGQLTEQYQKYSEAYQNVLQMHKQNPSIYTEEDVEEAKRLKDLAYDEILEGTSATADEAGRDFIKTLVESGLSEEEKFAALTSHIEDKLNNGESLNKIADELGIDYSAGFEGGIRSGIHGVEEAVKALGDAAEATLRIRLDTHSPSKLSEKIGGWYDDGMVQGVVKGIPDVEAATAQMADAAVAGTLSIMNAQGASSVSAYSPVFREAYTSPFVPETPVTAHSDSSQSASPPNVTIYIGDEEIRGFVVKTVADENANSGGWSI